MLIALNSPKGTRMRNSCQLRYINLSDSLSRVAGISQVTILGGGQMPCDLVKPDQLAKLNNHRPESLTR